MPKKFIKKIIWKTRGGYRPKNFWDTWADTFMEDSWQVTLHPQHDWLLSKIKKLRPRSILEVGCGFGRNIKFLQDNNINAKLTGIDISHKMIKLAKKFVKSSNVTFKIAEATHLPFRDREFELVFTHGVFMHIPPTDIEGAIREIVRVAKKYIILIEQNYGGNEYTFIHSYKKLFKKLPVDIVEYKNNKKLGLDYYYYVKVR